MPHAFSWLVHSFVQPHHLKRSHTPRIICLSSRPCMHTCIHIVHYRITVCYSCNIQLYVSPCHSFISHSQGMPHRSTHVFHDPNRFTVFSKTLSSSTFDPPVFPSSALLMCWRLLNPARNSPSSVAMAWLFSTRRCVDLRRSLYTFQ